MKLLCFLFGHRPPFGYCDSEGEGYFRVHCGAVDGIGRHHAALWGACERCEETYKIGNIHIPSKYTQNGKTV